MGIIKTILDILLTTIAGALVVLFTIAAFFVILVPLIMLFNISLSFGISFVFGLIIFWMIGKAVFTDD